MTEAKRGPGKPRKEPEQSKAPTATEQIEALNLRRRDGNGFIVPMPSPMTLGGFREWLHKVAEEGSAGDMEIAWQYGTQNVHWKDKLHNEYVQLAKAAGKRYHALEEQALEEQRQERAAHAERTKIANRQRAIAAAEAKLAALRAG